MATGTTKQRIRRPYSSPRQEARQQRILEVAREEITKFGYDAITMQNLAEEAGVSTKTLYNLYGSKDELLLSAVEGLMEELREHSMLLNARDGVEYLMATCEVSAQHLVDAPHYSEVLARALFQAEKNHRLTQALLGRIRRQAEKAFAISQQQGEIDPEVDPKALADLFYGSPVGGCIGLE